MSKADENGWVSVKDKLPEYKTKVMVLRPNDFTGKTDILMAYLHPVHKNGTTYGRMDCPQITFNDYWSLPSIAPMEDITHWQPLPKLPKPPINQ